MISFAAHKETINLAMQNGINLVALLLCDNDLIKRAVSTRIKFYGKRHKIIHKILRRFKICNTKEFRLNSQRNFIVYFIFKELAQS
ncbi:hypothetical protein [uncultured Campylobacter sp.]|uniref:hypothetical protein n=1 Tax=uncultured Campylobacter sp. TaxID=218934 RepID=UPI00262D82C9|nr:hypothetical protein [uncultured Campylobacter sp.]